MRGLPWARPLYYDDDEGDNDDADDDNDDTDDDDDEGDNDDGDDDDDGTRLRGLPWACRGQVHSVTTVTHFEASLELPWEATLAVLK